MEACTERVGGVTVADKKHPRLRYAQVTLPSERQAGEHGTPVSLAQGMSRGARPVSGRAKKRPALRFSCSRLIYLSGGCWWGTCRVPISRRFLTELRQRKLPDYLSA